MTQQGAQTGSPDREEGYSPEPQRMPGLAAGPRLAPDLNFPPDPELVAQGWQRRFIADRIRSKEVGKLYSELGYEVRYEPVKPRDLSDECGDCRLATAFFMTIYTRKKSSQKG